MSEKRFMIVVEYDGAFSVGSEVIRDFKTEKEVDENIYEMCELLNSLNDENEELKKQMQRLYNYFADWFDDRVPSSDFSEMWDNVKEDEKWEKSDVE